MSKSEKSTSKSKGFTAEERAAMKERAKELKANASKEEAEKAVLEKIDELAEPERTIAKRVHELVQANAPMLAPRLWYGMPAYAKDGKVLCFYQSAQKFDTRYGTLGFTDVANLDDGNMWSVTYAIKQLTDVEEARLAEIIKQAVS